MSSPLGRGQEWMITNNFNILDSFSKVNSHDTELQKLYEEMEQQIKAEKDRIRAEVKQAKLVQLLVWC